MSENTIDFIKWIFNLTGNGFSIKIIDGDLYIDYIGFHVPISIYDSWVFKPLLLQRAIEEWNKKSYRNRFLTLGYDYISIRFASGRSTIWRWKQNYEYFDDILVTSIDEAKTEVLKYIYEYEQEKINDN